MRRIALLTLALALAAPAFAQEAAIRKNIAERLPNFPKIDEVSKTPIPGLFEVRAGTEVFYTDEQGETKTELIYPDEDDPPETRQVGARPWIWYVAGRPNMTQFTQAEDFVRAIFGGIGVPPILGGFGLWLWIWRRHRLRRQALASWLRLEASLPRVEFSRLDQIVPSPERRWRLSARVLHEGEWRDVRSAYVMSRQVPEFAADARIAVAVVVAVVVVAVRVVPVAVAVVRTVVVRVVVVARSTAVVANHVHRFARHAVERTTVPPDDVVVVDVDHSRTRLGLLHRERYAGDTGQADQDCESRLSCSARCESSATVVFSSLVSLLVLSATCFTSTMALLISSLVAFNTAMLVFRFSVMRWAWMASHPE